MMKLKRPIWVKAKICSFKGLSIHKCKEVEALVDTGADFLDIPVEVAEEIELKPTDKIAIETADGVREADATYSIVQVEDRWCSAPTTIGVTKSKVPVLGVLILERLGFNIDVQKGELIKTKKGFPRY